MLNYIWNIEWWDVNGSLIINALTGIILAFTALQVYYYTRATGRLANLTEKQIKINIKPIVVVITIGNNLRLKNIRKSPALSITINDIVRKRNINEEYEFKFAKIAELAEREECGVGITPYYKDKPIIAPADAEKINKFLLDFESLAEKESYKLTINYNDVEMGKWRTVTLVDNKGFHFIDVKDLK